MMTSAQKSEISDKVAPLIFRAPLSEPGRTGVVAGDEERKAEELQWATGSSAAQMEEQRQHFRSAWAFPVPTSK